MPKPIYITKRSLEQYLALIQEGEDAVPGSIWCVEISPDPSATIKLQMFQRTPEAIRGGFRLDVFVPLKDHHIAPTTVRVQGEGSQGKGSTIQAALQKWAQNFRDDIRQMFAVLHRLEDEDG